MPNRGGPISGGGRPSGPAGASGGGANTTRVTTPSTNRLATPTRTVNPRPDAPQREGYAERVHIGSGAFDVPGAKCILHIGHKEHGPLHVHYQLDHGEIKLCLGDHDGKCPCGEPPCILRTSGKVPEGIKSAVLKRARKNLAAMRDACHAKLDEHGVYPFQT